MVKRFAIKPLVAMMCAGSLFTISNNAMASAYQLWEQDGATVGNYHAGRSASANDASTTFYNPAGIIRIKNQQLVLGDVAVMSDVKYKGTIAVNTVGVVPRGAVAQGGAFSQIPNLHYVAPINERLGFGLSVVAPFGLKTDWGRDTLLRYSATRTSIKVVDISPALAFAVTKQLSVGIGPDWQKMSAEFGQTGGLGFPGTFDTTGKTKGWSHAWGYHAGALFQFNDATRVGVAYNSQVVHHIRGNSKFVGPLATFLNGGPVVATNSRAAFTLPAYTSLSVYHQLDPRWALMGTAVYTQWNVFKNIRIQNNAAILAGAPSNTVLINIPANYHNSWNLSVGSEYQANEKIKLRGGLGYDQSPVPNAYRNVQVPDNDRIAVALGGHYQAWKTIGFDLGWTHLFITKTGNVNPPVQIVGSQQTTVNGTVNAAADVFGAQITWDLV